MMMMANIKLSAGDIEAIRQVASMGGRVGSLPVMVGIEVTGDGRLRVSTVSEDGAVWRHLQVAPPEGGVRATAVRANTLSDTLAAALGHGDITMTISPHTGSVAIEVLTADGGLVSKANLRGSAPRPVIELYDPRPSGALDTTALANLVTNAPSAPAGSVLPSVDLELSCVDGVIWGTYGFGGAMTLAPVGNGPGQWACGIPRVSLRPLLALGADAWIFRDESRLMVEDGVLSAIIPTIRPKGHAELIRRATEATSEVARLRPGEMMAAARMAAIGMQQFADRSTPAEFAITAEGVLEARAQEGPQAVKTAVALLRSGGEVALGTYDPIVVSDALRCVADRDECVVEFGQSLMSLGAGRIVTVIMQKLAKR